ncbi:MAG: glycosyltransferase family 4 protein [Thermodesulfobacteriota bacterium]
MRLLVVGHSYLTAFAQRKYVEMKRQCEGLELRILTPRAIPHVFQRYTRELAPELIKEEVVDIREFFGRSHMSYLLDPFRVAKVLREFQPDRIHIEEDPYSVVGVETVSVARLFCPQAKISFFIWDNLAREPRFPFNHIKWALNRYSLARAELVVCGNGEGEVLLREKKGYKGRSAVLPQLGIDQDAYKAEKNTELRNALNVPMDIPLIGYMGRLIPEKGILLFLEALHRLRELPWCAIIVGSGPLEDEIRGKWQPIFGERLVFRKAVPHAEVPAYMGAMDIFVLPSYATPTWKEQFGLVLAQAMMAGVPCVGSSSGAIPDVIGPGGLVFREKDTADLTAALEYLITNVEERSSLAQAARSFAMQKYTHAAVAKKYLAQYGWNYASPL